MGSKVKICNLDQIADGSSDGFVVDTDDGRCGIMIVRIGDVVVSYVNSCPHVGTPLEIRPGRFLDQNGEYILCSTHGALFQVHDGLCIAGPCVNDRLIPVELEISDGTLYVDQERLPTLWPPRPKGHSPDI